MRTNKNKAFLRVFLGLFLAELILVPFRKEAVAAGGDSTRYVRAYLQNEYPGVQEIGEAYITGPDGEANRKSKVNIYPVEPGTKIQGYTIKSEHLRQDNIQNLEALYSSIVGQKPNYDYRIAYLEMETSKVYVVAVTDKNVIFWSNGYRGFSDPGTTGRSL